MNYALATIEPIAEAIAPPGAGVAVTSDIAGLEPAWRSFEATAIGHVFQTHAFVAAWCAHVAPVIGVEPVFVTGTAEDGCLLYLLPLGVRRKLGARTLEWLGGDQADYHGGLFDPDYFDHLAADKAAFDEFLKGVAATIGGIDQVHFTQMPAEIDGRASPFLHMRTHPNANSAHSTTLGPDWDTYYAAKRGSGWRRTDRGKGRRLAELGDVSFVIAEDATTVDTILEALFAQKRQGLARIGVGDMFAATGVRDFYRQLAHDSLASNGNVQLSALMCGDRVAAASYGLLFRDTYYYVLHSYDLDGYANLSPGRQLMYRLMQWCFGNRIDRFDFTIGDEGYKDSWCETRLELVDAALALTGLGGVTSGALRLREGAKRRIKADRTLWSATVSIRKALLSLRGS